MRRLRRGLSVKRFLPILEWLPHYRTSWLASDLTAGLSVWALLVPEGIAYAAIAGVPPQFGLYAAMFGLLGYAVFGTSRQTVVGPTAALAAVSAVVVAMLAKAGSSQYLAFTATLAVVAGVFYALLGVVRMGWISNFLSKAVVGGFIFGFGIGLIIDQSHKILGVPSVEGSYFQKLIGTLRELPATSFPTLVVGAAAIGSLLLMRRLAPHLPRALITSAGAIAAVWVLGLTSFGVKVIGPVPRGLPSVVAPVLSASTMATLAVGALAVVFVGFTESIVCARETAVEHEYHIDPSQEMVAQGASNLASGIFGGFVIGGSLSKTTVADIYGQKSQLASVLGSGFVLLTVLLLAGLFTDLPEAVLGAVVIDAAIGLVKVREFRMFWRVSRRDFAAFAAAMLGILFIGVLAGVLIGVVLSLVLLISAASRSPVRELAYDKEQEVFVPADADPLAEPYDNVVVAELDGPLFFADADSFRRRMLELAETRRKDAGSGVVVDMGPTTFVDADGADAIVRLCEQLGKQGRKLTLARVEDRMKPILGRSGALSAVGEDNVFETVREAVAAIEGEGKTGQGS